MDINLKLAKRLKEWREKFGYTQKNLAELSGVGYKNLQRYESEHPPFARLDTIEKLAKAFKTTPSKLLDF